MIPTIRAHRGLGILFAEPGAPGAPRPSRRAACASPAPDVLGGGRLLRAQGVRRAIACNHRQGESRRRGKLLLRTLVSELQAHGGKPAEAVEKYGKAVELDSAMRRRAMPSPPSLPARKSKKKPLPKYEEVDTPGAERQGGTGLAALLADQGRVEDAVRHYEKALRIDPGYADAVDQLARLLEKQGNPDQAIGQYQATLKLEPNNQDVHFSARVRAGQTGQKGPGLCGV